MPINLTYPYLLCYITCDGHRPTVLETIRVLNEVSKRDCIVIMHAFVDFKDGFQ